MKQRTLCIDCSTVEHDFAREMSELCKSKAAAFIDAPVSGGIMGAQEKRLTFMVGGDSSPYSHAMPVLEAMGKRIIHCGNVSVEIS